MSMWTAFLMLVLLLSTVRGSGIGTCDFESHACNYTQNTAGSFRWVRTSGSTPSPGTGPSSDHTTGYGYYLYTEATGSFFGATSRLNPPVITSSGPVCLSWFYHMYGSNMGTLNVYVLPQGQPEELIWHRSGNQGGRWEVALETVNSPTGGFQVTFEGIRGSNDTSDIAIDDVQVTSGQCNCSNLPGLSVCGNGTCIAASSVCDGVVDCSDGSDESNCPTIRLVGGNSAIEGRVEIFYLGEWGTICDDLWDIRDARVACRELGYPVAIEARGQAYFGQGSGRIWLENVECTGREDMLQNCSHADWGSHDCSHAEDAGVVCATDCSSIQGLRLCGDGTCIAASSVCDGVDDCGDGSDEFNCSTIQTIRLVGGMAASEGRVEIFYLGEWGTICDDSWDIREAQVVCRQLGYPLAMEARGSASFGQGSGRIWLDNVACTGLEAMLQRCSHAGWGRHDCDHSEDAGVVCGRECSWGFDCGNSLCRPQSWVCDGKDDCKNSADESNCGNFTCQSYHFKCNNGHCINEGLRCDGRADCTDGSDELGCTYLSGCGTRNIQQGPVTRILGGEETQRGAWPWQVQLRSSNGQKMLCGAILIKPFWVLTAAHCVIGNWISNSGMTPWWSALRIALGRHRNDDLFSEGGVEVHTVARVIVHEDYDDDGFGINDITLIKLNRSAQTSRYINYACLPDKDTVFNENSYCYISGWGLVGSGSPASTLQELRVGLIPDDACQSPLSYGDSFNRSMTICAGYWDVHGDACRGDSGGPLVCATGEGTWSVAGIVNFGQLCHSPVARKPGVYARAQWYIDWIEKNTDESNACDAGGFKCNNTNYCVPQRLRCDGKADCQEGDDEFKCPCKSQEFQCDNGRRCIPSKWQCDGDNDCGDMSDERNCTCSSDEIRCDNGRCINSAYRCNGYDNCGDTTDERGCDSSSPSATTKTTTSQSMTTRSSMTPSSTTMSPSMPPETTPNKSPSTVESSSSGMSSSTSSKTTRPEAGQASSVSSSPTATHSVPQETTHPKSLTTRSTIVSSSSVVTPSEAPGTTLLQSPTTPHTTAYYSVVEPGVSTTGSRRTESTEETQTEVSNAVPVQINLGREVFTDDLRTMNSARYKQLANAIASQVAEPFKDDPNFDRADVIGFRPGSVIADVEVVFKNTVPVTDGLRAVSRLQEFINDNGGRLGDLEVSGVSYAPPGTSDDTPCRCQADVTCVGFKGTCYAFCSANSNYCRNGGSCKEIKNTISCDCSHGMIVQYSGDRCDSAGIGLVAIFLIVLVALLAGVVLSCLVIWRIKSNRSPKSRARVGNPGSSAGQSQLPMSVIRVPHGQQASGSSSDRRQPISQSFINTSQQCNGPRSSRGNAADNFYDNMVYRNH